MSKEAKRYTSVLIALITLISMACAKGPDQAPEPEPGAEPAAAPAAAASDDAPAHDASDYAHSVTEAGVQFLWTVAGNQLDVKLVAKTKGWIGIGFNPESGMKNANFLIGRVKNGEAEVQDHFGTLKTNHKADDKIGGTSHVSNVSGSETGDTTELAFSIPLDSGDANDGVLDPDAQTTVLLAYGKSDVMALKHKAFAILNVNLASGESQVVKVGP